MRAECPQCGAFLEASGVGSIAMSCEHGSLTVTSASAMFQPHQRHGGAQVSFWGPLWRKFNPPSAGEA